MLSLCERESWHERHLAAASSLEAVFPHPRFRPLRNKSEPTKERCYAQVSIVFCRSVVLCCLGCGPERHLQQLYINELYHNHQDQKNVKDGRWGAPGHWLPGRTQRRRRVYADQWPLYKGA